MVYSSPIALGKGALQLSVKEAWPSLQKVMKEGGQVVMKLSREQAKRLKQDTITFSWKTGVGAKVHKPMNCLQQQWEKAVFWLRKHLFKPRETQALFGDFVDTQLIKAKESGQSFIGAFNQHVALITGHQNKQQYQGLFTRDGQVIVPDSIKDKIKSYFPWGENIPQFMKEQFQKLSPS